MGSNDLSEEVVDEFFETDVGCPCRRGSGCSRKLVMEHLRSLGVVAPGSVAPPGRTQSAEAEPLVFSCLEEGTRPHGHDLRQSKR